MLVALCLLTVLSPVSSRAQLSHAPSSLMLSSLTRQALSCSALSRAKLSHAQLSHVPIGSLVHIADSRDKVALSCLALLYGQLSTFVLISLT